MNVIELDHATLSVGGREVLADISFAIKPGEFIGVLGPNGAGKTTLMRAILGLLPPSRGRTPRVRPAAAARRSGHRLPAAGAHPAAGFARARARLHRQFAARRTLGRAIASARRPRKIEATLAAVGARDLAERPLSDMSGGERQRLLLAQALIGEPRLLLLDEPLISLDYRYQEAVIDLVRRFARERDITVLFCAHELNQLIGALDRVLYLGNGHAALGTVEEVVTAPVLSRLYGAQIEVVHADGHIFVLSRGRDVERADHLHDHGHDHDHHHDHHPHA